jgi:trehalose/maltose transport system substrate-binding protein
MQASPHADAPNTQELYDLPDVLEPFPQLAISRQHRGTVVARPSIVSGEKYEDVSRAYIRALHSVLAGEEKASGAAAALEKELIHITGFRPGAPTNRALSR